MPNIKETLQIINHTLPEQSILLKGIHGIGKSQIIEDHYSKKGYRMVTLFLGQMADAGDLIGLPDREFNEETGYTHTVFRPPFWWPKSEGEKFILFLDELNRGKPEVMQCIMDMVLHRKLMGKKLPDGCMIVSAMNPLSDDGYYQVDELDPALLDRFNVYDFNPTHEEWLNWAMKTKINKNVIGFVATNVDLLDPITDSKSGKKSNDIQPSRRSWHKVSDILNADESIENNESLLQVILMGIVGSTATSRFKKYIREKRKNLTANTVIMKWDKAIQEKIKEYDLQDIIYMNRQICFWFKEYEKELLVNNTMQVQAMKGLARYLATIGSEPMAQFFNIMANDNNDGETYAKSIMKMNPDLAEKYFKTLHEKEDDEELEENIGEPESPQEDVF